MAELPRAVRLLRDYDVDIVSAYRFDRTGEGYAAGGLHVRLQRADPLAVRRQGARHQLRLQAAAGAAIFDHVELRSEGSFIDAELIIRATRLGLRDPPVRRRLLPAHPGRVDAQLARRDRHDPARDGRAARRAGEHPARSAAADSPIAALSVARLGAGRRSVTSPVASRRRRATTRHEPIDRPGPIRRTRRWPAGRRRGRGASAPWSSAGAAGGLGDDSAAPTRRTRRRRRSSTSRRSPTAADRRCRGRPSSTDAADRQDRPVGQHARRRLVRRRGERRSSSG